jgi:hypothetical protein
MAHVLAFLERAGMDGIISAGQAQVLERNQRCTKSSCPCTVMCDVGSGSRLLTEQAPFWVSGKVNRNRMSEISS